MTALPPKYEAALIAYIALYDNCNKSTCWKSIGEAIRKYGSPYTGVVYRGHSAANSEIRAETPFFSTSPVRQMAELFVETNWNASEDGTKIGHLFKIHLVNVPVLRTDQILYTFTEEVISELRRLNGDRKISKGSGVYTFDEYLPYLKKTIDNLVFQRTPGNDTEILVLSGGTFYISNDMKQKGYSEAGNDRMHVLETWYTFSTGGSRRTRRRKRSRKTKK